MLCCWFGCLFLTGSVARVKDRRSLFGGGDVMANITLRDGNARSKLDLDYPGSHLRKPENHSAVGAVKGFMGQCKRSEFWSWWEGKSHKIWAERYFPRKVQKAIAGTQNDGSGRWSGFLFEMAPFWATCLSFLGEVTDPYSLKSSWWSLRVSDVGGSDNQPNQREGLTTDICYLEDHVSAGW